MQNWFECKIAYEKILENGMQKKVTESYLVDALSVTEAEARVIEEVRGSIKGYFTVPVVKRLRVSELFFNENGDRFYKVKVYFITLDEKSGNEKKNGCNNDCSGILLERSYLRTGRRYEGNFGRLYDCFRFRNCDHGCISL